MSLPPETPFSLGVVASEIGTDPAEIAAVARELGLTSVEVNGLFGKQIDELSDDEADRAARVFAEAGLPVVALCPGLFKPVYLPEAPEGFAGHAPYQEHLRVLARTLELTRRFAGPDGGAVPYVRTFSFRRPGMIGGGNPSPRLPNGGAIDERALDLIAHGLALAVKRAEEEGASLLLENVRSCWGNSGINAARIIGRVGSPSLRALWDPANAYASGETFPTGWRAVRQYLAHVHVKDVSVVDGASGLTEWECIGAGEARMHDEIGQLWALPYRGAVHLETHWVPDDGSSGTPETHRGLMDIIRAVAGEVA